MSLPSSHRSQSRRRSSGRCRQLLRPALFPLLFPPYCFPSVHRMLPVHRQHRPPRSALPLLSGSPFRLLPVVNEDRQYSHLYFPLAGSKVRSPPQFGHLYVITSIFYPSFPGAAVVLDGYLFSFTVLVFRSSSRTCRYSPFRMRRPIFLPLPVSGCHSSNRIYRCSRFHTCRRSTPSALHFRSLSRNCRCSPFRRSIFHTPFAASCCALAAACCCICC